jgi:diguanylate cyclase (GGDEF)-like protein
MKGINKQRGLYLSIFASLTLFTLLIILESFAYNALVSEKKNEISEKYIYIEDSISHVIDTNFNILKGFSAFVQTTDEFSASKVYHFLDVLFEGSNTFIRNIGILEDTTIIWNYPPDENKDAIGIDLSQIETQRESVLKVKNENIIVLVGPVNLVQGGLGYIIRMPIHRDDSYFGQISIVINGDQFIEFLDKTQETFEVKFQIADGEKIIYNQNYVKDEKDLDLSLSNDFFSWHILIQPEDGWQLKGPWFILLPFLFMMASGLLGFKVYNAYIDSSENKHNASHDALTGLYNRYYLYKYAETLFNIAEINQYNIGLIVLDIDSFKHINDTYGHKCGDEILINFANKMKLELRNGQEMFRIGGDEFIVILENISDRELLQTISDRLKETIKNYEIISEHKLAISFSSGIAMYPDDGSNLDILYNIADQNMYDDKQK